MAQNKAQQLLELAADSQITQFAAGPINFIFSVISLDLLRSVASLTILAFDCVISLQREVEMVWKRSKSPVKWLYVGLNSFASRFNYQPELQIWMQGTSATIMLCTTDIILLLRIWILCDRSRRIVYMFLLMIIVEFGTMLGIITATVNSVREYVHVEFIKGCYAQGTVPSYFSAFPVPSFIVSCAMLIVTVRNCQRRIAVSRPYNTHSIAMVFLRDGLLWFLVSALLAPPQIVLFALGRPTLLQVLMLPSFAGFSIIGARVLLNMMEVAAEGPAANAIELNTIPSQTP
ncbi:hypothetical protein K438DRAFT_1984335 [Mycena galopus ATCC 62051]|nr:hypothetical protein K438DRAFT_1984335 [Mycena galopus ATCC 62051]